MSEDQLSEAAGRSADLSDVTHKKQHRGQAGKKDEERNQEQLSIVINTNGVCHHMSPCCCICLMVDQCALNIYM